MKKTFTLLLAFVAIMSSTLTAQNQLDSAWAGYEVFKDDIKSAYADGYWYGNGNDSIFYRTEAMAYSGVASMCFSYNEGVPAGNKKIQGSLFPNGINKLDSLAPSDYLISYMIYLEEGNNMSQINTTVAAPWTVIVWDISTTPRGEWVEMKQIVNFADSVGGPYNLQIPTTLNATATGKQVFYIDAHSFSKVEESGPYKEGNVFNEDFMGFEKAADAADGWFPQKNAGDGYFFFPIDMKASGMYSLQLSIPAAATDVPANLKLQAVVGEGNAVVLAGGIYDLYLKVFIDENTSIKTLNTNYSKDDIGAFKAVSWDLRDVEKGKWVELHRVDTLPAYSASKLVVQTKRDSIDFSTNACNIYIDDLAAVFNSEYVPMPELSITVPAEDSVFVTADAAIQFKVDNFVIGTDGKLSYTIDGGTSLMHETDAAIELTDLANGAHQVILELLDMDGASLNPIVTDTVNFTVQLPAGIKNDFSLAVSVYPNPAMDYVHINTEVGSQIDIYNLLGARVKTAFQLSETTKVDISDLHSGAYLLHISSKNSRSVSKIQVK